MSVDRRAEVAALAVFGAFTCNGFNVGGWAARLPAVRDELAVSPQQIGLMLLLGALGSLLTLPLSGLIVQRMGARRAVAAFATVNVAGLVLAAVGVELGSLWFTAGTLFLFGAGIAVWDAAMNLEGAAVERRLGRSVMPRFHGGFSVGTVLGSLVGALAAWMHAALLSHFLVALTVSLAFVFWCVRHFLPDEVHTVPTPAAPEATPVPVLVPDPPGAVRSAVAAWREPRTLLIGVIVLAAGLTEGSAMDWVSLAVVDGFETANAVGAIGYGVFVAAMTGMRFLGTGLLDRWGRVVVLRTTAGIALLGVLLFVLPPLLPLALVGVALWGFGAALSFPVGMSAAADEPRMAPPRIAVVSTIGYSSFLAGPPLMGLLAEHVGYRPALLAVALPLAVALIVIPAAAPLPHTQRSGN